jgi:hypothetical protein
VAWRAHGRLFDAVEIRRRFFQGILPRRSARGLIGFQAMADSSRPPFLLDDYDRQQTQPHQIYEPGGPDEGESGKGQDDSIADGQFLEHTTYDYRGQTS